MNFKKIQRFPYVQERKRKKIRGEKITGKNASFYLPPLWGNMAYSRNISRVPELTSKAVMMFEQMNEGHQFLVLGKINPVEKIAL